MFILYSLTELIDYHQFRRMITLEWNTIFATTSHFKLNDQKNPRVLIYLFKDMKIIEHDYSYSNRILKFMFRRNRSALFIQNLSFISNNKHQLLDKSYTHHLFWWLRFLSVNIQHIVLFSVDFIFLGKVLEFEYLYLQDTIA